jgi:hypothetical protein
MIVGFFLFFLGGVGFGFSLESKAKFIPLIFPLLLSLGAFIQWGLDGAIFLRLIIALIVTLVGIALGTMLSARGSGETAGAR